MQPRNEIMIIQESGFASARLPVVSRVKPHLARKQRLPRSASTGRAVRHEGNVAASARCSQGCLDTRRPSANDQDFLMGCHQDNYTSGYLLIVYCKVDTINKGTS